MKSKNLWVILILMLSITLIWLVFFWEPVVEKESSLFNATLAETPTGGDFTLRGPDGLVSLADYRGKVVIVYFGYTFCPDICPTSLSVLAQALSALTPAELEKVKGIFISVDPERDSMEVLKAYAPFFHPNIVGASGTTEQIVDVAKRYGARYMKQKPNEYGLYSVDHSAFIYVLAPDGKLADSLPHGTSAQKMLETIRMQLQKATN